jgi:NADH-quinone oxidoreductase subunit L
MEHEEGFARFFVYLNLFMAMMLTLVLGGNLLVTFVGWEGVGLCSYLLIGFFYDKPFDTRTGLTCADAGRKAFLVNRIGDFAFVIGMLYLITTFGTLDYRGIGDAIAGTVTRTTRSSSRSASCCSSARAGSRRRSPSTSGCRTRWPVPRRCPR